MFYSANPILIDNHSSYLDSSRVFTGEYMDEFGVTPYLVPNNAEVLMLGLGAGGGIRPILASHKNISITGVDMDAASVLACRELFAREFPQLKVETVAQEARTYLMENPRQFDAIWLDLYHPDAYCPLYFSDEFYDLVKLRLRSGGVLLINAYGLPNHFFPLERSGVQARVAHKLSGHFGFLSAVPYRRNLTLIAAEQAPKLYDCAPHAGLTIQDAQAQRAQALRVADLKKLFPMPCAPEAEDTALFANLNLEMFRLWSTMVDEVNACGGSIWSPRDLITLIQTEAVATPVLQRAVSQNSSLLWCFPILAAGESRVQPLCLEWLFNWFRAEAPALRHANPEAYQKVWLPQLLSIVQQPGQRFQQYETDLQRFIQAEIK